MNGVTLAVAVAIAVVATVAFAISRVYGQRRVEPSRVLNAASRGGTHAARRTQRALVVRQFNANLDRVIEAIAPLPLLRAQPVAALARISARLRDPGSDRLGRRLELASQVLRRTSGPNQVDHLLPELHHVRRSRLRHRRYSFSPPRG